MNYNPDYIISPGEVLQDYLEAYGLSIQNLATKINTTPEIVKQLLDNTIPVATFAKAFEQIFSRPVHFWVNLDSQYC